jgi:hypothetical protein
MKCKRRELSRLACDRTAFGTQPWSPAHCEIMPRYPWYRTNHDFISRQTTTFPIPVCIASRIQPIATRAVLLRQGFCTASPWDSLLCPALNVVEIAASRHCRPFERRKAGTWMRASYESGRRMRGILSSACAYSASQQGRHHLQAHCELSTLEQAARSA